HSLALRPWVCWTYSRPSILSNSANVRAPNVLVQLDLEPDGQAVLEDPSGQIFQRQFIVRRGEEHGVGFVLKFFAKYIAAPFVIRARGDHEFELIVGRRQPDVLPANRAGLAAVGALDIDDLDHRPRHAV